MLTVFWRGAHSQQFPDGIKKKLNHISLSHLQHTCPTEQQICSRQRYRNILRRLKEIRPRDLKTTEVKSRCNINYPVIWKNQQAKPKLCFMGCPHMSLHQLTDWTERIEQGLAAAGNQKVVIPTVFTAAPAVIERFNATPYAERLRKTGVIVSYICPLMYMNNPLSERMPVITSSNKLRTYTSARYYTDDEILLQITKGGDQA